MTRTLYDIYVPRNNANVRVARYTDMDAAVEEVKRMMRRDPEQPVRLEILPPACQQPPTDPAPVRPYVEGFAQRLSDAVADLSGAKHRPTSYRYGDQPRSQTEMELYASWEAQRGDTGEPNPFETMVQKVTQQHHDIVEKACEEALQGGEYGVRIDIYPGRTEARVDPTVPYGRTVEHQHIIDPWSAL